MKNLLQKSSKQKAQTILELFFVILNVTFLFGLCYYMMALFDVSQKQTMLARTQAFIELGNFSDYGQSQHGSDNIKDERSQLLFVPGKETKGAKIKLPSVKSFQDAVQGDLELDGIRLLKSTNEKYWEIFRFPKGITKLKWERTQGEPFFKEIPLSQTLAIVSNRSLRLNQDVSSQLFGDLGGSSGGIGGGTGMYSSSINYQALADRVAQMYLPQGSGLVDNREVLTSLLQQIARQDPSLADEARRIETNVNVADSLQGGAQAALISLALQAAMQAGLQAIGGALAGDTPAGGLSEGSGSGLEAPSGGAVANASVDVGGSTISASASAGGGLASAGAGIAAPTASFGTAAQSFFGSLIPSINLVDGASLLYNAGQVFTFTSQVLSTANLGFQVAGKDIEGLQIASLATGAIGGVAGGIAQLQTFSSGGVLGDAGKYSDLFGGLAKTTGGAGSVASYLDPKTGQAFGIASTGLGLGAGVSGLSENWGSYDGFDKIGGIGGVTAQSGALLSQITPGNDLGIGLSTAGGALGVVGGVGNFAQDLSAGKYDGKNSELMAMAGGLTASASGVGVGVAQLTDNEELGMTFGYGALAGGALATVGAVGMMGKAIGKGLESLKKEEPASSDGALANAPMSIDPSQASENSAFASANTGADLFEAVDAPAGGAAEFSKAPETPKSSFQQLNDGLKTASIVNGLSNSGLQVAAATLALKKANNDSSDAFRTSLANAQGAGSVQNVSDALQELDATGGFDKATEGMTADEALAFHRNIQVMNDTIQRQATAVAQGKTLSLEEMQKGQEAATTAQNMLDARRGIPAPGTPERLAYDKQQILSAQSTATQMNSDYRNLFNEDEEVWSMTLHAENYLENGTEVIENSPGSIDQTRLWGEQQASRIEQFRLAYYPGSSPEALRLERAAAAYRNINFVSPANALSRIQVALDAAETSYDAKTNALRNLAFPCRDGDLC